MTDNTPTSDKTSREQLLLKEQLIKSFYNLTQTIKIHSENNKLFLDCAKNFLLAVKHLGENEEYLIIQFIGKRIYLQECKVFYRPETNILYDNLFQYFEKRGIQGIRFYTNIEEASLKELTTFIQIFNHAELQEYPLNWLKKQLDAKKFPWAELILKPVARTQDDLTEKKERAKKTYAHVLSSVKEVGEKLTSNKTVGLNKTRRVIQKMVDLIMEDEPLFKALSTIRIYDDYTYAHSVNVAILAMCMGKRIMLSQKSLERLGLCGILHDLGKIEVPKKILNKPGKLTKEEFEVMKQHSLISVRLITKIKAERDRKAQILLPPFEHHLKYDLSGYPQTNRKKEVSLFGRILTIADVYDAITSPRVYRPSVLSQDRALGFMLEGAGTDFDPILLKVFINMLGVYPVGTLLKLDKGVGLVTIQPEDAAAPEKENKSSNGFNGTRPWVVLLVSDGKGGIKKGKEVSLDERDPRTGEFVRNIIGSLSPSEFGIQPAEFIF